ncbi:MAG: hypothetical protein PUA69_05770 [Erysipelotrichaceae bacterium]|nr:hypothetical protein [Erysipelotrichaceae bacterium]
MAESIKKDIPEGFTLSMAFMDCLPVLFFSISAGILSSRFDSVLFLTGAVIVIIAGALKVCWKFILALLKKDISFFNKQMRYLMPLGFLLMISGLIINQDKWSLSIVIKHILSFPSWLFFLTGIAGMICMSYYAKHLDGRNAKNNWKEQGVNALAQLCFMIGILL